MVLRAIALACAMSAMAAPRGGAAEPLIVSAAVSLTEALTECAAAFRARTGQEVRLNFAASNALARQIVHGAPVDVFVSADLAQMQVVAEAGAIDAATRVAIASNTLVVIVPLGRNGSAEDGGDGRWVDPSVLATPRIRRIAVGDPRAVPAGGYARVWLDRSGLWSAVRGKLVPSASVRGVLTAVEAGAVDAGIVYRTDALASRRVAVAFEAHGADAPAITYPAAVTTSARDARAARSFVAFLSGAEGQRILARRGFLPAPR